MATHQPSVNQADHEDYIDIELSSSSDFLCYFISSPPQTREFEFQITSVSRDRESTTSPADELFYKGKLLPLNLPTHLQMARKILHSSSTEENYSLPPVTTDSSTTSANSSTPLDSLNISPSESCRFSNELNADEFFLEWSIEKNIFITDHPKKSSGKNLQQIKQFALCQKLKASSSYLKSLFVKFGCSDASSCAKAACTPEAKTASKGKHCLNMFRKAPNKIPFRKTDNREKFQIPTTLMKSIDRAILEKGTVRSQRWSFFGVIQRLSDTNSWSSSTASSGSSSFSFGSSGFNDLQVLKRISCGTESELESSVEGAITHCKQSQRLFSSSKVVSDFDSGNAVCGDRSRKRRTLHLLMVTGES